MADLRLESLEIARRYVCEGVAVGVDLEIWFLVPSWHRPSLILNYGVAEFINFVFLEEIVKKAGSNSWSWLVNSLILVVRREVVFVFLGKIFVEFQLTRV